MDKPKVILLNASRCTGSCGIFMSNHSHLHGELGSDNHPRLKKGTQIFTSKIIYDHGNTVETVNTIYTLE